MGAGHASGTDSEGYVALLQAQSKEGCKITAHPTHSEEAVASLAGHQQSYDTGVPEAEGDCCKCSQLYTDDAADPDLAAADNSLGCEQSTVSKPCSPYSSAINSQKKTKHKQKRKTSRKHKRR